MSLYSLFLMLAGTVSLTVLNDGAAASSAPAVMSPAAFQRAAAFMHAARPVERSLFAFYFEHGSAEAVRAALDEYQNPDGGFGGLEPDVGWQESTSVSTLIALNLLREVGTDASDARVERAFRYLRQTFDPSLKSWYLVPPHDNKRPHAPWWDFNEKYPESFAWFQDNPRPDVLACLYTFPCPEMDQLRTLLTVTIMKRLDGLETAPDIGGMECYARLYETRGIPAALREKLGERLSQWFKQRLEGDPTRWTEYRLRPLDMAPTADSALRALVDPALIERNLDYLIMHQKENGAWPVYWTWGNVFPETWPKSELKWEAILTLRYLRALQSYGRIAE